MEEIHYEPGEDGVSLVGYAVRCYSCPAVSDEYTIEADAKNAWIKESLK